MLSHLRQRFCSHVRFTHRETEAQKGEDAVPKSHGLERGKPNSFHVMGIYRHLCCPSLACLCVSSPAPPHLPSASLDLPLLQPESALRLRPWAGNNVEQQCGPDRLQRPLAAMWHAGVLERVVPRLLTLTLPRGESENAQALRGPCTAA